MTGKNVAKMTKPEGAAAEHAWPFRESSATELDESRCLRRGILGSFIGSASGSNGMDGIVALTSRLDQSRKAVDGPSWAVGASK